MRVGLLRRDIVWEIMREYNGLLRRISVTYLVTYSYDNGKENKLFLSAS